MITRYNEAMTEHYFTAQPSSEAREHNITYSARGFAYSVLAPDGVFSAQQLDRGTQALLTKVPHTELSHADALCVDVGCGWGGTDVCVSPRIPTCHSAGGRHQRARVSCCSA